MIKFEFVDRMISNGFQMKEPPISLPKKATKFSCGYDFFNPEKVTIEPKEIKYVKTGIKAQFSEDTALLLLNRSSNPKKKGLVLANRNWLSGV